MGLFFADLEVQCRPYLQLVGVNLELMMVFIVLRVSRESELQGWFGIDIGKVKETLLFRPQLYICQNLRFVFIQLTLIRK